MTLFAELKRRHVFRVAGAYLLGAWVVLQVSDIVLPALGLPAWTLKLIVIAVILGFPLALLLGWLFDAPPALRLSRPVAIGAVGVIGLAAIGAFVVRADRGDANLDANVIAVLPFRVGGDQAVEYLRESMLDLLQARLGTSSGPRTVEPRTMLAAWRREVGNEKEDLSEDASRTLARSLGAGRVLLGSAIATPTELTISGTLVQVSDGSVLARESVAGARDSVAVLVNRLAAALLIREAGEVREREAGLAAAPLDALQDYLAGRKAARRGDYFNAMELFGRAFERDSTFVDAAFAMVATNAWIGTVFTTAGLRVIPAVAGMRDRLSARDRSLFLAMPMVGPNYPRPSTNAEIIAQAERATSLAPDSPEHWVLLGQVLSAYGAAASHTDWPVRSADALERAIALDSSFTPAIGARLFSAMRTGDRDATARYARLFETRVASGYSVDMLLWAAARTRRDSATALRWRDRKDGLSRTDYMQKLLTVVLHSAAFALPLDDARWALNELERNAATEPERGGAMLADQAVMFAEGRALPRELELPDVYGPGWAMTLLQQSIIEPAFRRVGSEAIAMEAAGAYRLPTESGPTRWPPLQLCFAELHRVTGGDFSGVAESIRRLRNFAKLDAPPLARDTWLSLDFRLCPLLLEVLTERPPVTGQRWPKLDELDAMLRGGVRGWGEVGVSPAALANYTVARLREAQGDVPAALAAIRRRDVDYFPQYLWSLPAFLRQEGRLAALNGDVAGAIHAYDQYLSLRTNPGPLLQPQRDSVIKERAALAAR